MAIETAIAAATLASSIALFVFERRAAAIDLKRARFGDALAAVQKWMELPYRIRRRQPGEASRHALASEINGLQESLAFHQSWLELEGPTVHRAYRDLVEAARAAARLSLAAAWSTAPVSTDEGMNLGSLEIGDISEPTRVFVEEVGKSLALWRFWRWH